MKTINQLIAELEKTIVFFEKSNPEISKSSVAWHIEHSLKVITQISLAVSSSNPSNYKWRFNFGRVLVLGFNKIPRGKGKAPKSVLPEGDISSETLKQSIVNAKNGVLKLEKLNANHHFFHPYFGQLNLSSTKKFIAIHTNHHLKIIKDIIN
jgi:hypothetical protein